MLLPNGLAFADLDLEYAPTAGFRYLPAPLGGFALRNGLDPEALIADENHACELIADWYVLHRQAGGDADPAAEAALSHVQVEQIRTATSLGRRLVPHVSAADSTSDS